MKQVLLRFRLEAVLVRLNSTIRFAERHRRRVWLLRPKRSDAAFQSRGRNDPWRVSSKPEETAGHRRSGELLLVNAAQMMPGQGSTETGSSAISSTS